MEKHKIVPDVIPTAPKEQISVTYSSGATVSEGNKLKPRQAKDIPKVVWNADPSALYTLCLTDPDAPSRQDPKFREWHHWLVVNIPGNNIDSGDTLSEYIGAGPPKGTGFHRYVFLIYKQASKLECNEKRLKSSSGEGRGKFSTQKFATKYNLDDPIAGNFFQAEWDDYVPELYKRLKP